MATHEQTFLGPVFETMRDDGLLTFGEDENSYGLAAEFVRLASAAGVLIDADRACPECYFDDRADSLDAAWAEAEAALPEGWAITNLGVTQDGWQAWATLVPSHDEEFEAEYGPTPVAAVRALAAKLRERGDPK